MATVGSYSRFEPHRGEMFSYAAKAVIFEQIERQSRKSIPNPSGSMSVTSPAPSFTKMSKQTANSSNHASSEHETNTEGMAHDDDASLQTLQALLCLLVCGAWGPRHLIKEAVFIQSITASRARDCGLFEPDESGIHDWHTWIRKEVRKRTAISVYSFLNLMCIAYNQPPLISNGEVQCGLPVASKEWAAETAEEWKIRRSTETGLSFHDGVESLFSYPTTRITKLCLPAFANYILILSILQQIYFLRQAYSNSTKTQPQESLRSGDTEAITRALRAWQALWERSPESSIDPQSGMGPTAFNSTGLLRLAWVRLYSDLGSYTNLASRDSAMIAAAFRNAPPLQRSPKITQAVLHAAHALAVPVRMGIEYVAKTQNVSWGVQHSMSNLECAIFLSKWLEQIAVTAADQPFGTEEWIIIELLEAMVQEAGLERTTISVRMAHDKEQKIFQLAADVSRLWAEIFQGIHVFDMVTTIGTSLSQYANLMISTYSPRST